MSRKRRLDALLIAQDIVQDRRAALDLIETGNVFVNGLPAKNAASLYAPGSNIVLKQQAMYVSRGGEKLAAGLDAFQIDPNDTVCADIGCSTGGFTDALLQRGAQRVYCVDVGYGILHWKLRQDDRTVVLERTNARYLTGDQIPEPIDLAVLDASFISLQLLLRPLLQFFRGSIQILALVKPQFELAREKVGSGGVVRESELHREAQHMVRQYGLDLGLHCQGVVPSPIFGAKGNREFLIFFTG